MPISRPPRSVCRTTIRTPTCHESQSRNHGSGTWTDGLAPEEVRAALEEATEDAYDEYEHIEG